MNNLIEIVADQHGVGAQEFISAIKGNIVPRNCSDADFLAFLATCKATGLNPLTKEIYALPKKGGGVQPTIAIDGFLKLMNQNPEFDGLETEDNHDDAGNLISITCRIYRKDRSRATVCTEYLRECRRSSDPWKQWPNRMLRHRAIAQCARMAFELSGVMERDEAEAFTQDAPATVTVQAGASKTEQLKAQLIASEPTEAPVIQHKTFANFIDEMNEAQTLDQLKAVARDIKHHVTDEAQLQELREQFEGFKFNLGAVTNAD